MLRPPTRPLPRAPAPRPQLQQVRQARAEAELPNGGAARERLRAMVLDLAGPPPAPGGGEEDLAPRIPSSSLSLSGSLGGSLDGEEGAGALQPTKIEIIDGLWAPTLLLPREGKTFVTLAGTAAASVNAVVDAAAGSGGYLGIAGSFAFGGLLGFALAPRLAVTYELAFKDGSSGGGGGRKKAGGGGGGAWWAQRGSGPGPRGGAGSSISSVDAEDGAYWRPQLVDVVPPARRANAVVGAAAALYAGLGVWLLWSGDFL